ncbi:GGDEF domain-containing protein [Thermopolyspora sp. NPDC052614]|uniref:GGDEF domain-containing protein n=1 Tax=Thermopolyspora sp. NPDC052614 TaxID=3155682 RepID=UPI0034170C5C
MVAADQVSAKPQGVIAARAGRWPLLGERRALVGYVCCVVALDLAALGIAIAGTEIHGHDLVIFAALLACGAVCIEASRRLGVPAGVSRDLLSAWWLPVALLLPPVYALLAPLPVQLLLQLRVRETMVYRRVFSSAAIGLSAGAASLAFHELVPIAGGYVLGVNTTLWLAIGCGVLFTVLNTALIAIAAHTAEPRPPWRQVLWDRESAILDLVELCLGVLVTIACALTPWLLLVTLPPIVLLQRSLLHAQLQAAARTDGKTGLLNAAAWQREADTEIARARRTGETLALVILDIDHFKKVNDEHGHLVGDRVLAGVAATLRSQVREYDVVGRFGGEEFVVLLPNTEVVEARSVAERLRMHVANMAVPVNDVSITVTVSAGVAVMNLHGEDLLDLLAAADLALYRAKELGRDRVCLPAIQPPPDPRRPLR